MSSHFELWFTNDQGVRISDMLGNSPLTQALRFTATRVANGIGTITVDVNGNTFDQSLLRRDNMMQLWHAPAGGTLRHWRTYFLRGWKYTMTAGGGTTLQLNGACLNDLFRRRVVARGKGEGEHTRFDGYYDNALRIVMRDAELATLGVIGNPGASTRGWADLTVEVDTSSTELITEANRITDLSYQPLLDGSGSGVLTRIADAAQENEDIGLFFDIVPSAINATSIALKFRVYVGQPGADRTSNGPVFSPENGTLTDVELEYDYSNEVNEVYGGKIPDRDTNSLRAIAKSSEQRASRWNFCEAWTSSDSVQDAVDIIRQSRIVRFIGTIQQTPATVFGRDWDWGDKVRAQFRGISFDTILRAVTIQVDETGKETISARLDSTE